MLSSTEIMQLIQSLIWLLAGVGAFIVGMNFMGGALEKSAGSGMKRLLEKISNNRLSGVGIGAGVTAIIQSSSASTGVVITMVGTGVLPLDLALFIILGANIGTCVTALLASVGANANSKRVALIHFTFIVIGTVLFTVLIWIFREPAVKLLISLFPGNDPMSLQMRVSVFHVIFNVTTTCMLLPFVKQLVNYSCKVIKGKKDQKENLSLSFVDERLLTMAPVALMQVKKKSIICCRWWKKISSTLLPP